MTFSVTLCANCEMPVSDYGPRARNSPTGWVHWGFWQGIRCARRLVGAQPGRVLAYEEYLAWLDERTPALGCLVPVLSGIARIGHQAGGDEGS